jgi:phosphoadenosine phosphosulfate reductase
VLQFVAREGTDAMYQSIDLRKACCQMRKMEPLSRALAGKQPGSPACAANSPARAPTCPVQDQQR